MPSDEYTVYKTLVSDQNDKNLLENLLAYHFYQAARKGIVYDFVSRNKIAPTEEFLYDILATDEMISDYRQDAHSEIQAQILIETKSANKKDSYFKRVVDKALLDFSAKTLTTIVLFLITFLILQVAISFGLIKFIISISHIFPSIKDQICE